MSLDSWLQTNNYYTASDDVPSPSHLVYTGHKGGKIYIPRTKEYEFLSRYSDDLISGVKLYYIEQRPITFKFMIDLDISDTEYWDKLKIKTVTAIIHEVVSNFFDTTRVVICCTSPEKTKGDKIHTGIHLIWPNLFVTSETALCLRLGIIQKLKMSNVSKKVSNSELDWDTIIDEVIYTRTGYRMVGSDKMIKGIPENRPLILLFVMDIDLTLSEAYFNRLCSNTKSLILETSIRYVIDAYIFSGMNMTRVPEWLEMDPILKQEARVKNGIRGTPVNYECHGIIDRFINLHLSNYSGTVKEVSRYEDGNLLVKTSSKYCMNINREHNSCGIYFFVCFNGLYQKCLCPCNKMNGRIKGLCKDYTSDIYPFNETIQKVLFPTMFREHFSDAKDTKDTKEKSIKKTKVPKVPKAPKVKAYGINTQTPLKLQEDKCMQLLNDIMF